MAMQYLLWFAVNWTEEEVMKGKNEWMKRKKDQFFDCFVSIVLKFDLSWRAKKQSYSRIFSSFDKSNCCILNFLIWKKGRKEDSYNNLKREDHIIKHSFVGFFCFFFFIFFCPCKNCCKSQVFWFDSVSMFWHCLSLSLVEYSVGIFP